MSEPGMNVHCVKCESCATVIVLRGGGAVAHITCALSGKHLTHLMPGIPLACLALRGEIVVDTSIPEERHGTVELAR
jgi:hypothetical protein